MLIDTNIIIDHLRGEEKASALLSKIENGIIKGYISTIVEAEVLSGFHLNARKVEEINKLLSIFQRIEIDSEIAQIGAEFRRKYRCDLIDGLIAACAWKMGVELVTRNIRHFINIKEISLHHLD
ncbi:type II toxin-antitoxin system VapC family toxin [Candidatus Saganbacteria bacterium]|nr:type II toxin-antitoxin system VapC family toxin [Candidatus Saganbacteria bacterium]